MEDFDTFMNRFVRSFKRAFFPLDLKTPRRLWPMRLLALIACLYSVRLLPLADASGLINEVFFYCALVTYLIVDELKKLWDRVERLESITQVHHASEKQPAKTVLST